MKIRMLGLAITLMTLAGVSFAANKTYTGEIMDSACAAMGSHDAHPEMTAYYCTLACVKAGAKFVLYDATSKTIYQLDDQNLAQYSGAKVAVTGTLNGSTKTIHVASVKALS